MWWTVFDCVNKYVNPRSVWVTPPLDIFSSSSHPLVATPLFYCDKWWYAYRNDTTQKSGETFSEISVKICEKCAIVVILLRRKKIAKSVIYYTRVNGYSAILKG